MHDLLEGCLPYVMKEMLNVFMKEKIITIPLLEDAVLQFPYGISDVLNKPSVISATTLKSKDHGLKQTGMCIGNNALVIIIS